MTLEASSKEGNWACLMVAGGKSKLPDLLGRQCQSRARRIYKRLMLVVRGELTMVDEANGLVMGRPARISYGLGG